MNDQVAIRRAEADDLETIVQFNRAMAVETEGKTLDEATVRAGVRAALERPEVSPYYLALMDGGPAGQAMVTAEWSDWRNAWFWWLQSVYVLPDHRGRGVFRAIYRHIRTEARGRGDVCGLRLYVEQANQPAIKTYTALGMTRPRYVLMEDDWSTVGHVRDAT